MATAPNDRARDAHYHPVKATARFKAFIEGTAALATNAATARARREAQRVRETTYARGELGGH